MIDFSKALVKAMKLFIDNSAVRVAYYIGIGAIYLFALASLIRSIAALIGSI